MLGLIKKDLLTIKGNIKIILVIFFVFIIMTLEGKQDISFILPLICIMMTMSTFSYDEFNNFNAYAITFPNGRNNVVKSKYLAALILIFASTIVTSIVSVIISNINNTDITLILSTILGGVFAVILIQAIMYPIIFKFGIEKGRIGLFAGAFIITALLGILMSTINIDEDTLERIMDFINSYFMIIIPIFMVVVLTISYQISKRIYLKKEF